MVPRTKKNQTLIRKITPQTYKNIYYHTKNVYKLITDFV